MLFSCTAFFSHIWTSHHRDSHYYRLQQMRSLHLKPCYCISQLAITLNWLMLSYCWVEDGHLPCAAFGWAGLVPTQDVESSKCCCGRPVQFCSTHTARGSVLVVFVFSLKWSQTLDTFFRFQTLSLLSSIAPTFWLKHGICHCLVHVEHDPGAERKWPLKRNWWLKEYSRQKMPFFFFVKLELLVYLPFPTT